MKKTTGLAVLFVAIGLWVVSDSRAVQAQHGASPDHGQRGSHDASAHRVAQQCADQFEQVVASGRGFGLAFAADQNGYPGPMHVLELKDQLALSADQEAAMHRLMSEMFAESRPKSARLLEAERKLRALFAGRSVTEASLRAAVADVERARADVRLVHLTAHLKTRALLTDEQRRRYHAARWSPPRGDR